MRNKKQLQSDHSTLSDLKTVIGSYEEIAATRMRKVKKSVLQNREFLGGLSDIYQRVMSTYRLYSEKRRGHGGKQVATLRVLPTNGKTVSILISTNTGLYGDIVKKAFDLFSKSILNNSHDIVIAGRVGKRMFENFAGKRTYKYFEVTDSSTDSKQMRDILDYILSYSNIIVYHGLFINMLSQQATATFVTGKALNIDDSKKIEALKCIIEPSVEEVSKFFEKQILSSIFEQAVYESNLSKFASRMVSLDYANENIGLSLKKVNFAKLKLRHTRDNLNQLERISGVTLWE